MSKVNQFKAEYVGSRQNLIGKTAIILVLLEDPSRCTAQFDDLKLGQHHTHAWREYQTADFWIHLPERCYCGMTQPSYFRAVKGR